LAVLLRRKLKSAIPVPFGCAVRPFSLLGHNQGVHIHEIELRNTFVPAHVHQCSKTPSVVPANGKKEVRLYAYFVNFYYSCRPLPPIREFLEGEESDTGERMAQRRQGQ
jgi:hypothetical protein